VAPLSGRPGARGALQGTGCATVWNVPTHRKLAALSRRWNLTGWRAIGSLDEGHGEFRPERPGATMASDAWARAIGALHCRRQAWSYTSAADGPQGCRGTAVKAEKRVERTADGPALPPSPAQLVKQARRSSELGSALAAFDTVRPYLPQVNQPNAPNVTFATGTNT